MPRTCPPHASLARRNQLPCSSNSTQKRYVTPPAPAMPYFVPAPDGLRCVRTSFLSNRAPPTNFLSHPRHPAGGTHQKFLLERYSAAPYNPPGLPPTTIQGLILVYDIALSRAFANRRP
jgi:hypothetical protein